MLSALLMVQHMKYKIKDIIKDVFDRPQMYWLHNDFCLEVIMELDTWSGPNYEPLIVQSDSFIFIEVQDTSRIYFESIGLEITQYNPEHPGSYQEHYYYLDSFTFYF